MQSRISSNIRKEMDRADILVFLLSQDFIASAECMKEWSYAKTALSKKRPIFRIPIIVGHCSWLDLLDSDDIKALPHDGRPVTDFCNVAIAWHHIYEGLRDVVDELRNAFYPKQDFINEIEEIDFFSQQHIQLEDIFTFPTLQCYPPQTDTVELLEEQITDTSQLMDKQYVLMNGEDMSGKTALKRHLFIHLYQQSKPVPVIDLEQITRLSFEDISFRSYRVQVHGDYTLWKKRPNKTLICDNWLRIWFDGSHFFGR